MTTLNINAVSGNISAATGDAVTFSSTGSITIDSDLSKPSPPGGAFSLTAANGYGIFAKSAGATSPVSVTSVGDIDAKWGISASGNGAVTVNSTGDITSTGLVPIPTNRPVNGAILAVSTGTGAVKVTNKGDLTAVVYGIGARSAGGDVIINHTGNITSASWEGISAIANVGSVQITSKGNIKAKTYGIILQGSGDQSLSSTGNIAADYYGAFAFSGTGAVTVVSNGDVTARSIGIVAGSGGTSAVSVTIASGTVTGTGGPLLRPENADIPSGTAVFAYGRGNLSVAIGGAASGAAKADAAGVAFGRSGFDGKDNGLIVLSGGLVNSASGINGLAIRGASGNEAVKNSGTVTGNVDLGSGSNSFLNQAGGQFNMGATVKLGAGNTLSNAGTLSPGGNGVAATTALTGNLGQSADGVMLVDIDPAAATADRVDVSGMAVLDGKVAANLLNPVSVSQEFTILSAAGGVTGNGLELQNTVAATLSLLYPNQNDVVLKVDVSFISGADTGTLNLNQTRLGGNLNTLIGDAGGVEPVLVELVGIVDFGDYEHALNQLLPEAYLHAAMAGLYSGQAFSGTLMGCRAREGTYAYIAEGQCLWMDAGGGNLNRGQTDDYLDSDQTAWWLGGGAEFALSDTVRASAGGRYERVSQDVHDNAHTDGSWGHIGAALSYNPGRWLVAGALSGGKGWLDTERNLDFGGFTHSAKGGQDLSYVHGKLRAAYLFDMGKLYAKPIADVDVTWLSYGDVNEDNGGGAGLDVSSQQETVFSATPMLELGGQFEMENGTLVRPYVRVGAAFYGDASLAIDSRFIGAPGGAADFMTELELDPVLADISAGLDVLAAENLNIRISYDGMFGETSSSNAGTLRLEWRL